MRYNLIPTRDLFDANNFFDHFFDKSTFQNSTWPVEKTADSNWAQFRVQEFADAYVIEGDLAGVKK